MTLSRYLLLLSAATLFALNTAQAAKDPVFTNYIQKCSTPKSDCAAALIELLEKKGQLWADISSDYAEGYLSLKSNRPEIIFVSNAVGQLGVESRGAQGVKPVLRLNTNDDAWDLLLTLAHEIHHYKTLMSRLPKIGSEALVDDCLTAYRVDGLKDETPAYLAEIKFWEESPGWFKDEFKKKTRKWGLMQNELLSYPDYYAKLRAKISADPLFISKKYIETGRYPTCTLKLVK